MTATLDGHDLLECSIRMSTRGTWVADGRVDTLEDISGSVILDVEGQRFVGTVRDARPDGGATEFRVVGGAGGLAPEEHPAKNYAASVTYGSVLADFMTASGETLSAAVTADVTSIRAANYQRQRGTIAANLEVMTDMQGWTWRVYDDGTVWLGAETWPVVTPDAEHVLEQSGREYIVVAVDAPELRPGVTWEGRRVYEVRHVLEESGELRSLVSTQPAMSDQMNDQMRRATRIRYARCYEATVIDQAADGSLQLQVADAAMTGRGLGKIPLWSGPGVTVRLTPGSRVLLWFRGGRADQPIALLHPDGTEVESMTITASGVSTVEGSEVHLGSGASELVALASLVKAQLDTLQAAFDAHTHTYAPGPGTTAAPLPLVGALADVAAAKTKAV